MSATNGGTAHSTQISSTASSLTSSLLTRFTPPAHCQTTYYSIDTPALGPLPTAYFEIYGKSCQLPTLFATYHTQIPVVFSPGVCPDRYLPATTITLPGGEQTDGQEGFHHDTTSICCSESLTLLTSGQRFSGNCGNTLTSSGLTLFRRTPTSGLPNHTVVNTFYFVDLPYTVAWASADLDSFVPKSLPLTVASEAKALATATSVSSTATNSNLSSRLSVGAQAGVGVGAAVAGIAIGVLLTWMFVRRRQNRNANNDPLMEIEGKDIKAPDHPKIAELDSNERPPEMPTKEKPIEMFTEVGHEVAQDWAAQEADNGDMRHELDANYRGKELPDIATPVDGMSPDKIKDDPIAAIEFPRDKKERPD